MDSEYARKIIAKDVQENRISKIVSPRYTLPFTEIITGTFVAYISPRVDNTLFIVENVNFAKTQASVFNALWDKI
jgi:hypothetical protein